MLESKPERPNIKNRLNCMMQKNMKQIRIYLVKQLSRLTIWLKNKDKEPETSVISLAPKILTKKEDIERIQPYLDELERSLNEKNITNIAITGTYGSGKSTIIKTFQDIHREYDYLNISLASFKDNDENSKKKSLNEIQNGDKKNAIAIDKEELEEKTDELKTQSSFNTNLERRLEISILQQIFYHVKPSKIPDSRFKRIKNNKWWSLLFSSIGLIFWLISIILLFKFDYLSQINPSTWNNSLNFDWITFISLIIFFTGIGFLAKNTIRLFSNSKINKLSIKGELELGDKVDKSVFNEHLEEIIYFFERTPYNVVIIEDLDRFDSTDIFTKLRELNILLNTSKLIKREISFIYAVKDELFTDKTERVKFFDYIIPIIPFINASNAGVKLNELIATRHLENVLTKDFIQDIVSFIDDVDMRLLINIFHEFCVYKENIPVEIHDNLFAIIVYKNMYPDDFGKLSKRDGDLYSFIANKSTYIKDLIDKIANQIKIKEEKIETIIKETISTEKELRAIYINAIHELIPDAVYFLDEKIPFSDLNIEEQFEKIKNSSNINYQFYYLSNNNYYRLNTKNSDIAFSTIENHISAKSYDQRVELIQDKRNNKIDKLKQEIELLINKKKEIQLWSLTEIFQEVDIDNHLKVFSDNQMMRSLILNGYINEDYEDYITLFHEGNITRDDNTFIKRIKSGIASKFDYQLSDKVRNLIKEIQDKYFKRQEILNFNLFDFLSENHSEYKSKYNDIISILSNGKEYSVTFIDEYIERGNNLPLFIKSICKSWNNWWYYMCEEKATNYPNEKLRKYLKIILENANSDDIIRLNKDNSLREFINSTADFIYLTNDSNQVQEVIKGLDVKIDKLSLPNTETKSLFDFIYENNIYQINEHNISLILTFNIENIDTSSIVKSNYSTILDSEQESLIDYIEENIEEYIKNIFLKLDHNIKEIEENVVRLLNKEELSVTTKTDIIQKQEIIISNLAEIDDYEVNKMLIEKNKIVVTWANLFHYYETLEEGSNLDKTLIGFLNQERNYDLLTKQKIKTELNRQTEEVIKSFSLKVINCNHLEYDSYVKLMESIPQYWDNLNFEVLNNDKVIWMVNNNFLNLTESNFSKLRDAFPNEHIKLIENQQDKLFSIWDEIFLSEEDVLLLLKSAIININNKMEIIKGIDESYITDNIDIAKHTCNVLADSELIELNYTVLESLIRSSSTIENKIKVINKQNQNLTDTLLRNLVELLGGNYPKLFKKQNKPKFSKTEYNETLFKNLEKRSMIIRIELFNEDKIKVFAKY